MFSIVRIVQPAVLLPVAAALLLSACAAPPASTAPALAGVSANGTQHGASTSPTSAASGRDTGQSTTQTVTTTADASGPQPGAGHASRPAAGAARPGSAPTATAPTPADYVTQTATSRKIPADHVQRLLAEASFNGTVSRLMTPSGKRIQRSWDTYRARFVEPIRIREGVAFWQQHRAALDAAAVRHGVPASILAAIIGVETLYGRQQGNFRVLDTLYTLGFHFPDPKRPERAQFFRDQLADLIQLDYEGRLDARQALGSYAGAMGVPQFMPGSLMRFAEDGSQDGKIDLFNNVDDAIASVASFLRLHGWLPGLPVFAPATLPEDPQSFVTGGLEATLTWRELAARGAKVIPASAASDPATIAWQAAPLGIIDLRNESRNQVSYRIATPNFFALTQYNRSYFYATSVAELAWELSQRMGYGQPY